MLPTPSSDVLQMLAEVIEAHDIRTTIVENRVMLPDSRLAFNLGVKPGPRESVIQLDVGTQAPMLGDGTVWESFAGMGATRLAAEHNALQKFVLGPLHALLSAFADHPSEGHEVRWLSWEGPAGSWRVCASRVLVYQVASDSSALAEEYPAFLQQLYELFVSEVSPGLHWCEVFFASLDGRPSAAEVQLDNWPWPHASEALARWHVPPPQGYSSGRHLLVALPEV